MHALLFCQVDLIARNRDDDPCGLQAELLRQKVRRHLPRVLTAIFVSNTPQHRVVVYVELVNVVLLAAPRPMFSPCEHDSDSQNGLVKLVAVGGHARHEVHTELPGSSHKHIEGDCERSDELSRLGEHRVACHRVQDVGHIEEHKPRCVVTPSEAVVWPACLIADEEPLVADGLGVAVVSGVYEVVAIHGSWAV